MSETPTMSDISHKMTEAQLLHEFGDRVESVEFVKRLDDIEVRTVYRFRDQSVGLSNA